MPRAEFELVSSYAPREQVKVIDLRSSELVPVGQAEMLSIYSPPNTISKLTGIYISVPNNPLATSGHNYAYVMHDFDQGTELRGVATFDADIVFDKSNWEQTSSSSGSIAPAQPDDKAAQVLVLKNMIFDNNIPLSFRYLNNTDADYSEERRYIAIVIEREIRFESGV